jgi:malonyl-CoA O-methyltransferase
MVSPHLAAQLAGRQIDLDTLLAIAQGQSDADRFVVEGAGGVLVPVNRSVLMVDLMRELGLPALVVARSTLGTINHTLLTLEALRGRGLTIVGVVMNGPPNDDNRTAIEVYGTTHVLGQVPVVERVDAETIGRLAQAIDPDGRLLEHMRP